MQLNFSYLQKVGTLKIEMLRLVGISFLVFYPIHEGKKKI
jgi:hypothetical protein